MAEYNPILSAPQGANKKPKRVGRGSSLKKKVNFQDTRLINSSSNFQMYYNLYHHVVRI